MINYSKCHQVKTFQLRRCYLLRTPKSQKVLPLPHLLGLDSREEAIPDAA